MSKALNLQAWPKPGIPSHRVRRLDMTHDSAGLSMAALNPAVAMVQP
jgi:hypothetical protein